MHYDVTSALLTNRQCTVGKFPITSALFSKSAFQAHCWKNCHHQRTVEKIVSALRQNHECSVCKITSALLAQSPARCLKNHRCLVGKITIALITKLPAHALTAKSPLSQDPKLTVLKITIAWKNPEPTRSDSDSSNWCYLLIFRKGQCHKMIYPLLVVHDSDPSGPDIHVLQ